MPFRTHTLLANNIQIHQIYTLRFYELVHKFYAVDALRQDLRNWSIKFTQLSWFGLGRASVAEKRAVHVNE